MPILIGNLRDLNKSPDIIYVRVDRASPLGNPFLLDKEGWRDYVIKAYREWLYRAYFDGVIDLAPFTQGRTWKGLKIAPKYKAPSIEEIRNEITYLKHLYNLGKDVVLLCWCHPWGCHAAVIRYLICDL
jgi:hypothetical protein